MLPTTERLRRNRMRRFVASVGIGTVAVLLSMIVHTATAQDMPGEIIIDDCVAKQSAVRFDHAAHAKTRECSTCHHTQEGLAAGSGDAVEKCSTCHNEPEKAETPKCSEMSPKKNPFHINCMGCHKEAVEKDSSVTAPTKCAECHPTG